MGVSRRLNALSDFMKTALFFFSHPRSSPAFSGVVLRAVPLLAAVAAFALAPRTHGFPPAPYYTLFGLVRDQVGQTLSADGANIILLKNGLEIARSPVVNGVKFDQNYELNIRIDQARSGTWMYSERAVAAEGSFSLAVELDGQWYYPIEASGSLTAGKGGERVRLNLTLGEDTDGDGLPDIWEMWQLYQAGFYPDANGNWPLHLIDRAGDLDGDGVSNWQEYLAGTFAGDAAERFELQIKEKTSTEVRFEFYAVTGKTYTLERSSDLKTWARVPFTIGSPGIGSLIHTAGEAGVVSAFATPSAASVQEFYRLTVR